MSQSSNTPVEITADTAELTTRFVSSDQSDRLNQALDLALEERAQVAGGGLPSEICQCINCCATH